MLDYGMIVVLGILVAVFSVLTIENQQNVGAAAGAALQAAIGALALVRERQA